MEYVVDSVSALREALGQKGSKTIRIKKGRYEVTETLALNDDTQIIAEKGVSLYGSRRIPLKKAQGIVKIALAEHGIAANVEFGGGPYGDFWKVYDIPKPHMDDCGPSMELFFGAKKMNLTRYPQKGYMGIERCLGITPRDCSYGEKTPIFAEGVFIPQDREIFEKNDPNDLFLVGYWAFDWATQRHAIEQYDPQTGVLQVKPPYHVFGYAAEWARFYALNVKSSLKKPGDWYIDRKKGDLYLIPYKNQTYVDVTVCENLFEGDGVKNVCIENIQIERCRRSGFRFADGSHITVKNCTVKHVGGWGVIADRCTDSLFTGMTVSHTGGGGIACSGGDRATLTPSGNIISHNTISQIAYWHRTYLAGIEINGVGIKVCGNTIKNVPHFAIAFQGNNHIIEGNEIANACAETGDAGAVYAGRDYTCRGNIIRYNYLHDIVGYQGTGAHPAFGLYFDDGMCSAEVYGNLFANIGAPAILLGGGRDFNIHDNTFYRCKSAMQMDNRLEVSGNTRNLERLEQVPYRSPIWKETYSELYRLLDDEPKKPKNNAFVRNTMIDSGPACFAGYSKPDTWALLKQEDNTEIV